MRAVGTTNRPAGAYPSQRADLFVTSDDQIEVQLRTEVGEKARTFFFTGDREAVMDFAYQLIGAALAIGERGEIRSKR